MIREEFINFFHFALLAVAVEFHGGQGWLVPYGQYIGYDAFPKKTLGSHRVIRLLAPRGRGQSGPWGRFLRISDVV